jgi:predicted dehydrogenase
MIRLGLMGCGTVADYGHIPTIQATDGLELVALFDPNPARLEAMQTKFEVPAGFTDPEAFLAGGLDAVTITSPAPYHLENVLAAVRCGLPVLCEKPLAMNEAEAETMIAAAEAAGVPLYVGFDYRFSPVSQTIGRLMAERAMGEPRALRLIYIWHLHGQRTADGRLNQRRVDRMREGGPMVDCGVHQIDLARFWTGSEFVRQNAFGVWQEEFEAPGHVWLHLDHANGVHTMVEISFSYGATAAQPRPQFVYEVIGTDGVLRYDREAKSFELRNSHGTTPLQFASEKSFSGMYAELARALASGAPGAMPTGSDGLIATRVARRATDEVIAARRNHS